MRRWFSTLNYRFAVLLTRVLVSTFARWEITGREHVPSAGPLVVISNHLHLLDPPLLTACCDRRLHPMAKRELFELPLIGWYLRSYGAFPVRRFSADIGALRVARTLLRDGEVVLMFPEGTRSRDGGMRAALPGAAMVAMLANAPVLPIAITGTEQVRVPGVFFAWARGARPHIRVAIGEPFHLAASGTDAASAERATDEMMRHIAALLPESYRGAYGIGSQGRVVFARQAESARGTSRPRAGALNDAPAPQQPPRPPVELQ